MICVLYFPICFLNYSVKVLIDKPIHVFLCNQAEPNLVSLCPFVALISVLKLILICFKLWHPSVVNLPVKNAFQSRQYCPMVTSIASPKAVRENICNYLTVIICRTIVWIAIWCSQASTSVMVATYVLTLMWLEQWPFQWATKLTTGTSAVCILITIWKVCI